MTDHQPTDAALLDQIRAVTIAERAKRTVEAKLAGMPDVSARRWARYVERCQEQGVEPIDLGRAVGQVLVARAVARAGRRP
jgi:hypothetical protein